MRRYETKNNNKSKDPDEEKDKDIDTSDLLRALVGVSNVAAGPGWAQSAKRLVEILVLGSRPVA